MKKNILGAAVLLFATIGAFATAKNTALDLVYFQDPEEGCIQVQATKCNFTGTPACNVALFDAVTGAPLGISGQIWVSPNPQNPALCQVAYRQTAQ